MKTKFFKLYMDAVDVELPDEYDVWHHMSPQEVLVDIALKRGINKRAQETLLFLAWGSDGQIIAIEELNVGASDGIIGTVREAFQAALLCNATSIATLHNHPTGRAFPSENDIKRCQKMIEIGKCLKIGFVEDVVIDYDGNNKSTYYEAYKGLKGKE